MPDVRSAAKRLAKVLEGIARGEAPGDAIRLAGLSYDQVLSDLTVLRDAALPAPEGSKPKGGALRLVAHADGASRGNPGQAACAVIVSDVNGEELLRRARRLGVATNNAAEYEGVILALELCSGLGAREVVLNLDSELVVRQLNGEYRVKNEGLKPLHDRARSLMRDFDSVEIAHVPRDRNKAADKLASETLKRSPKGKE